MIGRPSCRLRLNAAKAEPGQIKFINKDINRPDRIILGQILFQPLGKQSALTAVIANDKARHRILPPNHRRIIEGRFHTVWTPFGRRPVSQVTVDVAVAFEFANVTVAELASQKQCPRMTAFGQLFNAE
jgi:hypothetical protein